MITQESVTTVNRKCDKCDQWQIAIFTYFTESMWFCDECKLRDILKIAEDAKEIAEGIPIISDPSLGNGEYTIHQSEVGEYSVSIGGPPVNESLANTLLKLVEK